MRTTNGQLNEHPEKHLRDVIERAVRIKEAGISPELASNKSSHQIMASDIREGLYNLLNPNQGQLPDWQSEIISMKDFLLELLVLLGKPNILNELPEYLQKDASKKIFRLSEFFQTIDSEKTSAFMDWESLDFPTEEKSRSALFEYYSFNMEQLNKKYCSNYLLKDFHFEEKRLGEMNQFEKQMDEVI